MPGKRTATRLSAVALGLWSVLASAQAMEGGGGEIPRRLAPEQRAALVGSLRVAPEVVEALEARGAARVIVALEVRDEGSGRALERFPGPRERAALRRTGDDVLAAAGAHFLPIHRLRSLPAMTGAADVEGTLALAAHPAVRAVSPDLPQRAFLAQSLPLVGIPALRVQGVRGAGVTVAVIDTGVDFRHRALKKARVGEACFCSAPAGGCCPNGGEEQTGRNSAADGHGHGTHVAGIVASRGKAGAPKGAAPRAKLVAVRVLGADGSGFSSGTVAALDWLLTERPDVDVVNLSLGTDQLFKGTCDNKGAGVGAIYGAAVDALRERGTLVVAASGNGGSRRKMSMPACLTGAMSVGAGFDADFPLIDAGICLQVDAGPDDVACFSNRPRQLDIVAPGVLITSTRLRRGSTEQAGTSQAAPHVAGCAALLAGAFPAATPADLLAAMVDGGVPIADERGRPFPRLDCAAAAALLESGP